MIKIFDSKVTSKQLKGGHSGEMFGRFELLGGDFRVEDLDHFSWFSGDVGSHDVDDVVLVVDPDDLEPDQTGHLVADVTGHLLAGPHPTLVSAGADATGSPMALGRVHLRLTTKTVTFHHALISATRRFSFDVDVLSGLEVRCE